MIIDDPRRRKDADSGQPISLMPASCVPIGDTLSHAVPRQYAEEVFIGKLGHERDRALHV